ncbi:YciI family protein [Bogoriella caseilytica]|uniref:YCII-related domain-containing protein n=1 Tax=Bogoriella caseilytica TaxID=56055 RepID=A0A3N2BB85_9MICO|nr:YciI family protein [Bogoriella caseilytica]ROR72519.1 YCII-related domain-containing protein [Bogoriella caseilytica]
MTEATHLLIHRYRPGTGPQPGSAEHEEEMRQWAAVDAELRSSGVLVGGYAIADRGVLVGAAVGPDGERAWAPGEEILFAVHAIAVESDEAAVALARNMPTAEYGSIEVRPAMDG